MEVSDLRHQLLTFVCDAVETLSGQELVCFVTRGEDGTLTPQVLWGDAELLNDKLNGWVDHVPWNAPKSL